MRWGSTLPSCLGLHSHSLSLLLLFPVCISLLHVINSSLTHLSFIYLFVAFWSFSRLPVSLRLWESVCVDDCVSTCDSSFFFLCLWTCGTFSFLQDMCVCVCAYVLSVSIGILSGPDSVCDVVTDELFVCITSVCTRIMGLHRCLCISVNVFDGTCIWWCLYWESACQNTACSLSVMWAWKNECVWFKIESVCCVCVGRSVRVWMGS